MDTTAPEPRVLVIGLDPHRVPGPWDPAPVADAIAAGMARFVDAGVGVDSCLFGLDGSDDIEAVVVEALDRRPWEVVVVGGGVRKAEDQLDLFERIVNLVRRHAPDAAIAFNSMPGDTFDAAARWLDAKGERPEPRVTLVGDAGYCPGPAVGGSTSLAVAGAYVLAGELARAGGDHERAFPVYERAMAEHVRGSRAAALGAAKTLIPTSRLGVSGLAQGARLLSALPAGPSRALLRLTTKTARLHNSMTIDDYPPSLAASAGAGTR